MKFRTITSALLTVICLLSTAPLAQSAPREIPPLKDAYSGKFLVGATLSVAALRGRAPMDTAIAERHFNALTPENSMKPDALQPSEGRFTFDDADRFVDIARKCGATPVGHTLVWHQQTPAWFFQNPDGRPLTREVALERMRKHIAAVVGHYKGKITQWDVVNEAISDAPNEWLRPTPWRKAIGDDYIAEAFRAAHKADPKAILIYNDYNIELGYKRPKALRLLRSLLDQKVPIDAVGIQAHWRMDSPNFAEVEEAIKEFGALGLKVMITELDIGVLPTRYRGADLSASITMTPEQRKVMDPYAAGLPDEIARQHAERYRQAFAMFLRHRDVIKRVTLWGVHDGGSWLNGFPIRGRTDYPLLFDRKGNPKPAFEAVRRAADAGRLLSNEDASPTPDSQRSQDVKNTLPVREDKARNPIIWADVPDPAVIRVGDNYYMSSTTMHMSPGVPIMKSRDLVNWRLIGYACPSLGDNDALTLTNGKDAYGQGSWASSLRYHNGTYYVSTFSSTTGKTHVYRTKDIEKDRWTEAAFAPALHDHSLFFDDDGRVFMAYGSGDIRLLELTEDATAVKPGGIDQVIIPNASLAAGPNVGLPAEGSQLRKINGKYYLFSITWPRGGMRTQLVFRSDKLTGPYEGRVALSDAGVAQGGLIDTPAGEWYALLFQDCGSVGRVPFLVPASWEDGWPILGTGGKVPRKLSLPGAAGTGDTSVMAGASGIVSSDEFERRPGEPALPLAWQWNHNPDNRYWSLTERPGFLRLKTGRIDTELLRARNTLTQRTFGPKCSGTVSIDVSRMKDGDCAGMAAFQRKYGFVGVRQTGDVRSVVMVSAESDSPVELERFAVSSSEIFLRVDCDFVDRVDTARFFYSLDGKAWTAIGKPLRMVYTLPHFMGYRFGLFNFATKSSGGFVDFDYFRVSG